MKVSYKLAAVLALMCIAGCALRPVIAQEPDAPAGDAPADDAPADDAPADPPAGDAPAPGGGGGGGDCASKTNTSGCTVEDTNTGCCWDYVEAVCKESTDELAASLDFDGICRIRQTIDVDDMNADAACSASTLTMCNPASETEPSGCNVTKCFTTFPPLGEGGLANWTEAMKGDEAANTAAACYSGLNIMAEAGADGKTFAFEGGAPIALAVPFGKSVSFTAPEGDARPYFRVGRLNVTTVGNFSITYKATNAQGDESEGDIELEADGDFFKAEGYPRGPLYSLTITNGGDSEETKLHINRITLNVC